MDKLAITSVPIQQWEQPYDMEQALRNGNMFPALHKPFYIEEQMKQLDLKPEEEYEKKLRKIQEVAFCLTDITLFLDTHEKHQEAEAMRQQLLEQLKKLKEEFGKKHYPLTQECPGNCENMGIPWEGGKVHVAL